MPPCDFLRVAALRFFQGDSVPLYLFSMRAGDFERISAVSRVARNDKQELLGYQRSEVRKHILDIASYLNREDCVFPNSIIIALPPSVLYHQDTLDTGHLVFPCSVDQADRCWIIDGQQRASALKQCQQPDLRVPVTALSTSDIGFLRDQFIRINNSKPLPRGLISELLPTVQAPLSDSLSQRRTASQLCEMLNQGSSSPFQGQIRRATSSGKNATFSDTAVMKAITSNIFQPKGALYVYWDTGGGVVDIQGCYDELVAYWWGVRDVFPNAWTRPPRESRLTHGVGVAALGKLMDRVVPSYRQGCSRRIQAAQQLEHIRPFCHWTEGDWDILGGIAWDSLQNTPQHLRLLSDALTRVYLEQESIAR